MSSRKSERTEAAGPGIGRQIKTVLLIVIGVALVIVCLQNLADTPVQLLFWGVQLPLIVLLLVVAVAGFVLGWLTAKIRAGNKADKKND